MVPLHLDFQLILATSIARPDFGPEISEYVILVNFALTETAFDAQIMAVIIQEIDVEIDVNMRLVKQEAQQWIKDIKVVEDQILEMLGSYDQRVEAMIANEDLIETLQQSQMLQDKIGGALKEIAGFQYRLDQKKKDYALLTRRATKLFFLVAGFNKISPMYQFTHQWFFGVFLDVLKEEMKDKTLEDLKLEVGEFDRIMEHFTKTFFAMVCQQIFERDKMLFSFLLAYKQMEAATNIDFRLVKFFIIGPLMKVEKKKDDVPIVRQPQERKSGRAIVGSAFAPVLRQPTNFDAPCPRKLKQLAYERRRRAVPWMNKEQWKLVDKLSLITPFNQLNPKYSDCKNLAQHVEKNPDEWYDYIFKDRKEEEALNLAKRKTEHNKGGADEYREDNVRSFNNSAASEASSIDLNLSKAKTAPVKKIVVTKFGGSHIMPGGYDMFDYAEAWERIKEDRRIESHVTKQVGQTVTLKMREEYQKKPKQVRDEHELDEMFATWKSSSEDDSDSSSSSGDRRKTLYAEDSEDRLFNALSDQQNNNRKGNLQDELEIAEAIVHGIAMYSEFDVKAEEKNKGTEFKDMIVDSNLVKLCIFRCFRPDKLNQEIKRFICEFAGETFIEIPLFKYELVHQQSTRFRPILIIQGDNIDCREELTRIRKQSKIGMQSNGLYIIAVGSDNLSKIARTIIEAAATGGWVLIDNVHLNTSILNDLLQFLGQLVIMHTEFASKLNKLTEGINDHEKKEREKVFGLDVSRPHNIRGNVNLQKTLREQEAKDALIEKMRMPEGRANFAMDEANFLISHAKPDSLWEKARKARVDTKTEKYEVINKELESLKRLIDNPEMGYDDKAHQKMSEEKDLEKLLLPRKWQFFIKKTFRMFVSSLPLPDFPEQFARKCTKMALEMPNSIKRISKKNFESIQQDIITKEVHHKNEFKKLLMSVTILHSMISRKELYGSFGWSKAGYEFSPNDFDISISQLVDIFSNLEEEERIPCQLIHHILSYLNYGSVVTNEQDQLNLFEVIRAFIHKDMFRFFAQGEDSIGYDLTGYQLVEFRDTRVSGGTVYGEDPLAEDIHYAQSRNYKLPGVVKDRTHMLAFFNNIIPEDDRISIFGLSDAADFKAQGEIANHLMDKVFGHCFTLPFPSGASLAEAIKSSNIEEIPFDAIEQEESDIKKYYKFMRKFERIIEDLDDAKIWEEVDAGSEFDYTESGMSAFFNKEAKQYMSLVDRIIESIGSCIEVLQGLRTEDDVTRATFISLQSNRTPDEWTLNCYASFSTLSLFIDNLLERVRYIKGMIREINLSRGEDEDVRTFKIPLFYDQKALITTLLQLVSRKSSISIEKLKPLYKFMLPGEDPWDLNSSKISNSFYLEGLYLNGASWLYKEGTLDECIHTHKVSSKLPKIHMLIQKQEEEYSEINSPLKALKTKNLMDVMKTQVADVGKKQGLKDQQLHKAENKVVDLVRRYKDQLVGVQFVDVPMYVLSKRNRVLNLTTEDNFMIMRVPMPTKHFQPSYFVRRNIALLCYSDELV